MLDNEIDNSKKKQTTSEKILIAIYKKHYEQITNLNSDKRDVASTNRQNISSSCHYYNNRYSNLELKMNVESHDIHSSRFYNGKWNIETFGSEHVKKCTIECFASEMTQIIGVEYGLRSLIADLNDNDSGTIEKEKIDQKEHELKSMPYSERVYRAYNNIHSQFNNIPTTLEQLTVLEKILTHEKSTIKIDEHSFKCLNSSYNNYNPEIMVHHEEICPYSKTDSLSTFAKEHLALLEENEMSILDCHASDRYLDYLLDFLNTDNKDNNIGKLSSELSEKCSLERSDNNEIRVKRDIYKALLEEKSAELKHTKKRYKMMLNSFLDAINNITNEGLLALTTHTVSEDKKEIVVKKILAQMLHNKKGLEEHPILLTDNCLVNLSTDQSEKVYNNSILYDKIGDLKRETKFAIDGLLNLRDNSNLMQQMLQSIVQEILPYPKCRKQYNLIRDIDKLLKKISYQQENINKLLYDTQKHVYHEKKFPFNNFETIPDYQSYFSRNFKKVIQKITNTTKNMAYSSNIKNMIEDLQTNFTTYCYLSNSISKLSNNIRSFRSQIGDEIIIISKKILVDGCKVRSTEAFISSIKEDLENLNLSYTEKDFDTEDQKTDPKMSTNVAFSDPLFPTQRFTYSI